MHELTHTCPVVQGLLSLGARTAELGGNTVPNCEHTMFHLLGRKTMNTDSTYSGPETMRFHFTKGKN